MWRNGARERRYAIGLDLADLDLRDALAEALDAHPSLHPADGPAAPDLTITDRGPAPDDAPRLRLGEGTLPPDAGPELILSAAHVLAAGLALAPGEPPRRDPPAEAPRLSPREREVLALLVEGAPNKAIARTLGISVRTAKFHVAALLAKLHARNRAEAVARAVRDGLVVL